MQTPQLKIFELRIKVFLYSSIPCGDALGVVGRFIDETLAKDPKYLEYHKQNTYKYTFGSLFPIEREHVYKKETVYQFTLRTCDFHLAEYLLNQLPQGNTEWMKGLVGEVRVIPERHIATLYSLTPVIVKSKEKGYWRDDLSLVDFERRLKENLVKKYNLLTGQKMDEDFGLYTLLEFKNKCPVAMPYKGIRLLGDKIQLQIADNPQAQTLARVAIAEGLCEMNARGAGFVSYHFS